MADNNHPDDVVYMTHEGASEKGENGKLIPVAVTRHEFESLWAGVGWKLAAAPKEGK